VSNRVLAAGFGEKSHALVKLWDVADGRELGTWRTGLLRLAAFVPDGRVLTVDADGLTLREPATGNQLQTYTLTGGDRESPVAVSADGKRLAVGGNGKLGLWEVGSQVPFRERGGDVDRGSNGLAFHPDGWHVAVANEDGTVQVWDLRERDYRPPS